MAAEEHFTATIKVTKSRRPEPDRHTGVKPEKEVKEVAHFTVRAADLDTLIGKMKSHTDLISE